MDLKRAEPLTFDPGARQYRFRLWLKVGTAAGAGRYHFYWRRLALAALAATVAAWLLLAAAVWSFLRYGREWHDARYWEVALLPVRLREFRASLGRFYTAKGLAEMQRQNFWTARDHLVAGLRHAPADLEVRRTVAIALVQFGLLPRALDVLADGLRYKPDLEYLKLAFGWMHEARQDARTLQLAEQLLPAAPDTSLLHRFVALQAAIAHFEFGRYAEAEKVIGAWGLQDSLEGEIVLARCDWERGRADQAIARLEQEVARFAQRDELYTELIHLHRTAGRYDEARRYALLRQFNDPRGPGPRMDLLYSYHDTADLAARDREVALYLRDFGTDEKALLLLASFATDAGDEALLDRIIALARTRQFNLQAFQLQQALVAIHRGQYDRSLALLDTAGKETPPAADPGTRPADAAADGTPAEPKKAAVPPPPGSLWLGLRVVALFGAGQTRDANTKLTGLLQAAQLRADEARLLARELHHVGGAVPAAAFLRRVCEIDPSNEAARAELARLEAETGDRPALAESVGKLLALAKPPRQVLEEALLALDQPEDAPFVERIRASLRPAAAAHE